VAPTFGSSGGITWKGKGKKTVDVQQIRDRFTDLKIELDWVRVEKIVAYRNEIEHYHSKVPQSSARRLVSDSFIVIRDFVRDHLGLDPLKLLGPDVWNVLTEINEVHEKEKDECVKRIGKIDWEYATLHEALTQCTCKDCGSDLVDIVDDTSTRQDAEFKCRSCGAETAFATLVQLALSEVSGRHDEYGDPRIVNCPDCGEDTYVTSENACVLCGCEIDRECKRCMNDIPWSEYDGDGYCGWCLHMMAKDD
jgi:hypothetical protein